MTDSWAIGIDLGGTKIEGALIGSDGSLQHRIHYPTDVQGGAEAVIKQIILIVGEIQQNTEAPIKGIGIGIAGQIDNSSQLVRFAPNLKWRNLPLIQKLAPFIEKPIYMDNDVRVAARGEKNFGAGRACTNFICLYLGTGIGGGIVLNNALITGSNHTAGEFGHLTVQINGPLCTCGNHGCLEAFSSGWAIARKAREENIHQNPDSPLFKQENITAALVFQAASQRDPLALQIIDNAIEALIAGLVSIVNAWNPQRLILGGGLLKGYAPYLAEIERGIRQRALPSACETLEVLTSGCQDNGALLGAGVLVFESIHDKKC